MHLIDTSDIHVFSHCISAPPLAEAQRYSTSNLHGDVLKICGGIIFDFYPGLPQYLVYRGYIQRGSGLQVSNLPQTDVYLLFHGYSSAVKLSVSNLNTLIFARWLVKVGSLIIHES